MRFGAGFGIRLQIVNSVSEILGIFARHFGFQRIELDSQVLAGMRSGDALAQILETRAGLLRIGTR